MPSQLADATSSRSEKEMEDLRTLESKLNALIAKGEMIAAVEQYHADNCIYQEGNQPPRMGGKKGQKEYLSNLFKTVKTVNALTLHGQSIGDGITMSEWTFDLTTNDGPIVWNEVHTRRWKDGKVISERYYTAA